MIRLLIFTILSFSIMSQEQNTLYKDQWYLKNTGQSYLTRTDDLQFPTSKPDSRLIDINWLQDKDITPASSDKIIVAVIDVGLDYKHPDLKDRIWINHKRCSDPKNIQPQCYGQNIINPNDPDGVMDTIGHGTHVAGIIVANNNDMGIVGAAHKNVVVMPIKVLDRSVKSYLHNRRLLSDYYAMAIRFAIQNGAHVINISGGFPKHLLSEQFEKAIEEATAANIPIVASAGNNSKDLPVYPCRHQDVICVGSINNKAQFSKDTNYSQSVDMLAPGEHIVSTYPLDLESFIIRQYGYEALDGNSQAAPLVSATIANMLVANPDLSLNQIKAKLFSSTQEIQSSDKFSNFGSLDMRASVENSPDTFWLPLIKEDSLIYLEKDSLDFVYELNVKNLSKSASSIQLNLNSVDNIHFDKMSMNSPMIQPGKTYTFKLKGKASSLDIDHLLNLNFELTSTDYKKQHRLHLILSRKIEDIDSKKASIKSSLNAMNYNYIVPYQKRTLMKKVVDADHKQRPLAFYTTQSFKKSSRRVLAVHYFKDSQLLHKQISLSDNNFIMGIFRADYNQDGKFDYLVYGIRVNPSTGAEHLFKFYDSEFNPLYGQSSSTWNVKASYPYAELQTTRKTSSGEKQAVPIKLLKHEENKNNFSLYEIHDENLGNILVPVLELTGVSLPLGEIDPIDRRRPRIYKQFFVMKPKQNGAIYNIEPKPLLTNLVENDIREHLRGSLKPWQGILIDSTFKHQPNSFFASTGDGYDRKYFIFKFDEKLNFLSHEEIYNQNQSLVTNQIYPIYPFSNKYNFVSKMSDWQIRNSVFKEQSLVTSKNHASVNWDDEIYYHIQSYDLDGVHHYYSSRYWIHLFDQNGESFKIPIRRESSYVTVDNLFEQHQFSETFNMGYVSVNNQLNSSLTIDSTQLYGDFSYVAHRSPDGFLRPIRYTIQFPYECNYFATSRVSEKPYSSLIYVCNKDKQAFLRLVPLRY